MCKTPSPSSLSFVEKTSGRPSPGQVFRFRWTPWRLPRLLDIRSTTRGPICSLTGRMRRFSTFARISLVETITIDDLDRQLTQCLGVDGRASFSAIADVLGVSD